MNKYKCYRIQSVDGKLYINKCMYKLLPESFEYNFISFTMYIGPINECTLNNDLFDTQGMKLGDRAGRPRSPYGLNNV